MRGFRIAIGLLLACGVAAAWLAPGERALGGYTTSLVGRTRGQRANAIRAARAINGIVIESGREFSFNRAVGSWTPDRGYVLAPVSYEGELAVDWGGGVCQTSSTLYNAALLAGLEIAERHRHARAPGYVPPGRDAAVAQYDVDLRVRNPYCWPVRIHALIADESLGFQFLGRERGPMASVQCEPLAALDAAEVMRFDERLSAGQRSTINRGRRGVRVAVYRTYLRGPLAGSRELVSQDSYPPVNRVVELGAKR